MPATRSVRRHHIGRLKQNRRRDRIVSNSCAKPLGQHIVTPKPCSCWMCGNPRKFYGNGKAAKTMQELRWDEKEKEAA